MKEVCALAVLKGKEAKRDWKNISLTKRFVSRGILLKSYIKSGSVVAHVIVDTQIGIGLPSLK